MPTSRTEHYVLLHGEILNKMGKKGKTSKPATKKKPGLTSTRAGRATTKLIKSLKKKKK